MNNSNQAQSLGKMKQATDLSKLDDEEWDTGSKPNKETEMTIAVKSKEFGSKIEPLNEEKIAGKKQKGFQMPMRKSVRGLNTES